MKQTFIAAAIGVASLFTATQADANCKGAPQITLSDGAIGCVANVKVTEITKSRKSQNIKHAYNGGLVEVLMLNGKPIKAARTRTASKRGREICKRYNAQFLKQIKKPQSPFMAVVMDWKSNSGKVPSIRGFSSDAVAVYLTKTCRVVRVLRPW